MSILENIKAVQKRILDDTSGNEGVRIKKLAVAAIYGGMPNNVASEAWKAYMKEFVENQNPRQLARLTTADGNDLPYVESARAYLVGNGTCLPATSTGLPEGIKDFLDQNL